MSAPLAPSYSPTKSAAPQAFEGVSALSVPGVGPAFSLLRPYAMFGIQCLSTAAAEVRLDGSLDGYAWSQVGASTFSGAGIHTVACPPITYVRARLHATASVNPVTVWIAAIESQTANVNFSGDVTFDTSGLARETTLGSVLTALQDGFANTAGTVDLERVAATDLSGHRVVVPGAGGMVGYGDNSEVGQVDLSFWMTTGAAVANDLVSLLAVGTFTEPSWTWTPGAPIYLGVAGALTQTAPTAPTAAFLVKVATALTPTTIFYNPGLPILLT